MYNIFGEFDSAEEINQTAVSLRKEKDRDSLLTLAAENGIDYEIAEAFMSGELLFLADDMAAAIGKIEVEAAELQPTEIMADWVEYLKARCFESEEVAKAVRQKGKSLKGCIGQLLKWSFSNAKAVDKDIVKAAGITANVKLGIPGMGRAKKIITDYYLKEAQYEKK